MKEDILEQLVDDYLQSKGYFTMHNIKFLPDPNHPNFETLQDSNHSDIDVLGFNPKEIGPNRVWAVSCKSWQSGFVVPSILDAIENNKKQAGKDAWRGFRELVKPKWSEAFIRRVHEVTNESSFTYVTATTLIHGERSLWEKNSQFQKQMAGNPIRLIDLREMIEEVTKEMSKTVASSQLGRTLQLMKAAQLFK